MAKFLGVHTFPNRDTNRDRLIVLAGTATYDTVNLPPGSGSTSSIGGSGLAFRAPWYHGNSQREPSGEAFWLMARYYNTINNTGNDSLIIGVGRNGTEYVSVSAEDSTNKITIRVAGIVRATAASAAFSLSTWERIHLHFGGDDSGDVVSVYQDGDLTTPVVTYTLTNTDAINLAAIGGKPNEFYAATKSGAGNDRFDDFIAMDPADPAFEGIAFYGEFAVKDLRFNANSGETGEQQWSGGFANIDEVPPSDTDKITASAVGNLSMFLKAAIGEDNVFGAKLTARVTRTGTAAGTQIDLVSRDGVDEDAVTMTAPADGDVTAYFEEHPSGTDYSPSSFDTNRFGFRSVT